MKQYTLPIIEKSDQGPRLQRMVHAFLTLSRSPPLFLLKRPSLPFGKRYNRKPHPHPEKKRKSILWSNLTISGKSSRICGHRKKKRLPLLSGQHSSHLPRRQPDSRVSLFHLRLHGKTLFSHHRRGLRLRRQSRNCNLAQSLPLYSVYRRPPFISQGTPMIWIKQSVNPRLLPSHRNGHGWTRPPKRSSASRRSARC